MADDRYVDEVEVFPTANGQYAYRGVSNNGKVLHHSEEYPTDEVAGQMAHKYADQLGVPVTFVDD